MIKQYFPPAVIRFFKIYLLVLILFSLFRLGLFLSELDRIDESVKTSDIFAAFLMGIRFDLVISGYILIFPFFVSSILSLSKKTLPLIDKTIYFFTAILFSLAFLVCAVDIPYFNQFFSRFTISAFEWIDSPLFVLKMIFQEPRYWIIIIPYFLLIYLFFKYLKKIFIRTSENSKTKISISIPLYLLFLFLIFVGIRGRLEQKSPIRIGTAYFSNNAFLNQLGLNPNFTLIRSFLDSRKDENKRVQLMDETSSIRNVRTYLSINENQTESPISRKTNYDTLATHKYNVIVVIMESMSAGKMQRHGNTHQLTPFLDSLSEKSIYFENAYTAGIHTYNGIFSTLFSFPALFRQHPMKESSMRKYHGIFSTLKANGYSTLYFTTHDGQFDNVEGFLKANDCETVISKSNYPEDKIKTTLGVPDDFMFEFSIPVLNKISLQKKPFFAAFMTASDHGPYYIPEYFKPKNTQIKNQIVEYADFSLRKFIQLSSKQNWFKNTIFVFVADHGAAMDGTYSMALNYNHSPLIFYAPEIFKESKTISNFAGQIDIFPTIMGLLKLNYINNTPGIDLFNDKRPYIFFSADDKFAVIDQNWLLIVNSDKSKALYKYRVSDTHNYANEQKEITKKMYEYAASNMQVYQYLLNNNKQ